MANTILTPALIAREVFMRLYNNAVMAQLVHRDYSADFTGKQGDTVTARVPASFTANVFDRSSGISVQNATESGIAIVLDTLLDVSFAVTAEELTLDIEDFGAQFLDPAAKAFDQKIDQMLIAALAAATLEEVGVDTADPDDPTILVDAAKVLNDAAVPTTDRAGVLTTIAAANFVKDPLFSNASVAGDTSGLKEASLGRKFGVDLYMDQNLGTDSYVFHKSALCLATRTLAAPAGVAPSQVSVINMNGLGLRVVQAYSNTYKQDVISIDLLAGVKVLDANRAVRVLGDATP